MTAHDSALCPPKRKASTNKALFARVAKCHSREEKGFEQAEKAAVVLLQRALHDSTHGNEARALLNTLSSAQRKIYGLPDFLFETQTDA